MKELTEEQMTAYLRKVDFQERCLRDALGRYDLIPDATSLEGIEFSCKSMLELLHEIRNAAESNIN